MSKERISRPSVAQLFIAEFIFNEATLHILNEPESPERKKLQKNYKKRFNSLERKDKGDITRAFLKMLSDPADIVVSEHRTGLLGLLETMSMLNVDRLPEYLEDAVVQAGTDRADVMEPVIDAIHIASKYLSAKKFTKIMHSLNIVVSQYDEDDRSGLLQKMRDIKAPERWKSPAMQKWEEEMFIPERIKSLEGSGIPSQRKVFGRYSRLSHEEKKDLDERVVEWRKDKKTRAYITKQTGLSSNEVSEIIKRLIKEGRIPRKKSGVPKRDPL